MSSGSDCAWFDERRVSSVPLETTGDALGSGAARRVPPEICRSKRGSDGFALVRGHPRHPCQSLFRKKTGKSATRIPRIAAGEQSLTWSASIRANPRPIRFCSTRARPSSAGCAAYSTQCATVRRALITKVRAPRRAAGARVFRAVTLSTGLTGPNHPFPAITVLKVGRSFADTAPRTGVLRQCGRAATGKKWQSVNSWRRRRARR